MAARARGRSGQTVDGVTFVTGSYISKFEIVIYPFFLLPLRTLDMRVKRRRESWPFFFPAPIFYYTSFYFIFSTGSVKKY